jgi:hypothetical protein
VSPLRHRGRARKGRTRKHPSSVRLLLLSGIPATGKTEAGVKLHEHHGFRHLDFEDVETLRRFLGDGEAGLRRAIDDLKKDGRDVVITWGFVPDVQLEVVKLLRTLGFMWVWFDGDRPSARKEYLRLGRPVEAWDVQLAKIATRIDPFLDELEPVVVNTFDQEGKYRPREEILAQLLDLLEGRSARG